MPSLLNFLGVTNIPVSVGTQLFVSGFALLSLEILGIKILAPYLGTTMPIWASLIGVILLGGSVGYYIGGMLADMKENRNNLLLLSMLAGSGMFFIPLLSRIVEPFVSVVPYTVAALLGSALLFLLPSIFLSTLITYAIRMQVRSMGTLGQVHGDLFALATLGSIAGVFATSYLLTPFFSVSHIIFGLGVAILLSGLLVYAGSLWDI